MPWSTIRLQCWFDFVILVDPMSFLLKNQWSIFPFYNVLENYAFWCNSFVEVSHTIFGQYHFNMKHQVENHA